MGQLVTISNASAGCGMRTAEPDPHTCSKLSSVLISKTISTSPAGTHPLLQVRQVLGPLPAPTLLPFLHIPLLQVRQVLGPLLRRWPGPEQMKAANPAELQVRNMRAGRAAELFLERREDGPSEER